MSLKVGDIISFGRTFTQKDVELFSEISGDEGVHHLMPGDQGQLFVQGLLTATLPTKIGGDHNVIARTMKFEFTRPVFTGDAIECKVKIEQYEKLENKRMAIMASFSCTNQKNKIVMTGNFEGIILPE